MRKSVNYLILVSGLALAACASNPTGTDFLNDAAATCGARGLFEDGRTYETTTTGADINHAYSCVNAYLEHSPEYNAAVGDPAVDRTFINAMWEIEVARSKGLLTPEQAQAQSKTAIAAHGAN